MVPLEKDDDVAGNTSALVMRMFMNELEDSIVPSEVGVWITFGVCVDHCVNTTEWRLRGHIHVYP